MGLVHCVCCFHCLNSKTLKGLGMVFAVANPIPVYLSLFSLESLNEFKSKTHPFSATIIILSKMKYALENTLY